MSEHNNTRAPTEEETLCVHACRLCGTPCPLSSSLYHIEHYGAKHMNKLRAEAMRRRKEEAAATEDQSKAAAAAGGGASSQQQQQKKEPLRPVTNADLMTLLLDGDSPSPEREALASAAEAVAEDRRRQRLADIMASTTATASSQQSAVVPPPPHIRGPASDRPLVKRLYLLCPTCRTVSVPDPFLVSAAREKAEYDLHENNGDDDGYRAFLGRAVDVVTSHFEEEGKGKEAILGDGKKAEAKGEKKAGGVVVEEVSMKKRRVLLRGLDFGCGPGPTICDMLAERNETLLLENNVSSNTSSSSSSSAAAAAAVPFYDVTNYDKYYSHSGPEAVDAGAEVDVGPALKRAAGCSAASDNANNTGTGHRSVHVPNRYRFSAATEVVEHLADAGAELRRLWALLAPPTTTANKNAAEDVSGVECKEEGAAASPSVALTDAAMDARPSIFVIMTKRADIYGTGVAADATATSSTTASPNPSRPLSLSTDKFVNWHYKNDPTHITFFTDEAFAWCRDELFGGPEKCRLTIVGADVVVFEKIAA